MNNAVRFESLQPNDSPNVIKINAKKKKGDKVGLLIQFFYRTNCLAGVQQAWKSSIRFRAPILDAQ